MALPIIEEPIYGQVIVETSPWSTPFTWTNQTANIVGTVSYSEGGRIGVPGSSSVDVGSLNVTLKNVGTVPAVGNLIRVRALSTSQLVFTGYVQDVSQRIVFDDSVSYTTPITLTTLHCLDWVGYISQFQAVGVGGANFTTGADDTDSFYYWDSRIAALNKIVDATYATKMIAATPGTITSLPLGDTDRVGSFAEHLDLMCTTSETIWYGRHVIPTNKTTGRTGLVEVVAIGDYDSTGLTFTDVLGSAGQLHYTEIDFENSTQNVANTIVANNRVRFNITAPEVTKIGGFNQENFVIVNNTDVIGVGLDTTQQKSDATSITTYGNRQTEVETNVAVPAVSVGSVNLCTNPSMEYDDNGWSGSGSAVTRRRKPTEEASPFAAADGLWAMRTRIKAGILAPPVVFSGGESDGIPVTTAGINTYYLYTKAARGATSRADTRARARVQWYDADEALISTVYGAQVSLTNTNTWYDVNAGAVSAPANAVRATVAVEFNRSGGTQFPAGDVMWVDAVKFGKSTDTYFDGDTPWDATYGYFWTGGVGASPSYKVQNGVDDIADRLLTQYSTTSMRASRIRWNAQEDIAQVNKLVVGSTFSLVYKGTTTTYRIVGIDGNISPERYVIDYYIAKV